MIHSLRRGHHRQRRKHNLPWRTRPVQHKRVWIVHQNSLFVESMREATTRETAHVGIHPRLSMRPCTCTCTCACCTCPQHTPLPARDSMNEFQRPLLTCQFECEQERSPSMQHDDECCACIRALYTAIHFDNPRFAAESARCT